MLKLIPDRRYEVGKPAVRYINRLSITTFQVVNFFFLIWWSIYIFLHRADLGQLSEIQRLGAGLPPLIWVGISCTVLAILAGLSFSTMWVQHINHTYKTKVLSLSLSASWWAFLATIFLIIEGIELNFGIYSVMTFAAMWESSRLKE